MSSLPPGSHFILTLQPQNKVRSIPFPALKNAHSAHVLMLFYLGIDKTQYYNEKFGSERVKVMFERLSQSKRSSDQKNVSSLTLPASWQRCRNCV